MEHQSGANNHSSLHLKAKAYDQAVYKYSIHMFLMYFMNMAQPLHNG
jgi:hypothetical protein